MIKHIWSVLCQESIINQDNNMISLNNIIEEINLKQNKNKISKNSTKVLVPINHEIVSFLSKSDKNKQAKIQLKLTLLDPKMDKLEEKKFDVIIPVSKDKMRTRIKFASIPITTEGNYVYLVNIKQNKEFETVAQIPLEVKIN